MKLRPLKRDSELVGGEIRGYDYTVFKVRFKNSDARPDKRDRYRLIYYLKTLDQIVLINLYAKQE